MSTCMHSFSDVRDFEDLSIFIIHTSRVTFFQTVEAQWLKTRKCHLPSTTAQAPTSFVECESWNNNNKMKKHIHDEAMLHVTEDGFTVEVL